MPAPGPPVGSEQWLADMLNNADDITFEHMTQYPKLLRAFVRDLVREGDSDGLVIPLPDEAIPDCAEIYDPKDEKSPSKSEVHPKTKRQMGYHSSFRFLRAVI